jgi:RNA-directed DNA polymerase
VSNGATRPLTSLVEQGNLELEVAYSVGGVISPLLANIALHGMEAALGVWRRDGRIRSDRAVVRYADDYVVFCKTREDAEVVLVELAAWLAERGLVLHRRRPGSST